MQSATDSITERIESNKCRSANCLPGCSHGTGIQVRVRLAAVSTACVLAAIGSSCALAGGQDDALATPASTSSGATTPCDPDITSTVRSAMTDQTIAPGAFEITSVDCTPSEVFVHLGGTYTKYELERLCNYVLFRLQHDGHHPMALTVSDESGTWAVVYK